MNEVSWLACASASACNGYALNGIKFDDASTAIVLASNSAPANLAVYQSGRASSSTLTSLNFAFGVPNGSYTVRLHFSENSKTATGLRRFDIRSEGTTFFTDYDIFQRAGGRRKAVVETITVNVSDGTLNLDLLNKLDGSSINGIEIIPTGN